MHRKLKLLLFFVFSLFLLSQSSFAQKYRFAVWGDSQFQNPDVFEKIVKETELLKPDLVLHVGDMIHGYTYDINNARRQWARFKKQISPLTAPFYPTPGNHDVTTKEIQPAYLEAWGKDKLYYSFDYKNSHFIVLNVFLNQQFDTIPEEEFEWLKKDLEKAKNAGNIFITLHSPLYLNKKYDWNKVHDLLKKYPVRAVFSGHYHIYDYRKIDGISYFCLNSSGNMNYDDHLAGHSHHFLFVTVDGEKVNYAVIGEKRIYAPDAVKPGESSHSSKYFDTDKSITITDPSKGEIDTTVVVKVKNRAPESRNYKLTWMTDDYRWSFKPWGANIEIPAGKTKEMSFHIKGPEGKFLRNQLPKLEVAAPYKNLSGDITESRYYFKLFYPPETFAYKTDKNVKLDGKIDDAAWGNVDGINNLYTDYKFTPAKDRTVVKLIYDNNYLYVGIKGAEPDPGNLAAFAYGDIPLVFGDDDFEIFFDTNRDLKTFYRLMVNPKGTVLSSGPKGLFSFKFDVKTYTGKDFWSAEFKIPFKELNVELPSKGETWGFNVRRHRQQADPAQSDWSKMQEHPPYQPEYFGLLKFE